MKFEFLFVAFFISSFVSLEEISRPAIPPQPNFMDWESPQLRLTMFIGYLTCSEVPQFGCDLLTNSFPAFSGN